MSFYIFLHCVERSEGDRGSPHIESKRAGKWRRLHLIFSIWQGLPQKTIFKEEQGKEKTRRISNLQGIYKSPGSSLKIFVCILFCSLRMLSKCKFIHINNSS
ncbi:hypothetical protein ILYODFUR_027975 [Ilyodon furcidens]|uniref:Uncharacterized protein n=1 Tax=Ilyodon furcidens TaxID=33524 RepID=A0ABV0VA61_9TELE